MQAFWLGTWNVDPALAATGRAADAIASAGATRLAIEIVRADSDRFVVLISAADQLADPQVLQCRIGFANDTATCNAWRSHGFPVIDAGIRYDAGAGLLEVFSCFFSDLDSMCYGELLFSLRGVEFLSADEPVPPGFALYEQEQESPEPSHSATWMLRRKTKYTLGRSRARKLPAGSLEVQAPATRSPSLLPIRDGPLPVAQAWCGECVGEPEVVGARAAPARVRRSDLFGAAAFQFRHVEAMEFRLELEPDADVEEELDELIAPLNFHLADDPTRFRFRVTSPVVLIQLLRYGRMQLADPQPPLDATDYQSQHELLVRVQVGQYRDGDAQVRHPATHVPAIFVDNPWSKILGRDLQGFDKCLAEFCLAHESAPVALRPDGRLQRADAEPRALEDVAQVRLLDLVAGSTRSRPLLGIRHPHEQPVHWSAARRLDHLGGAFRSTLVRPRWRMSDFDAEDVGARFVVDAVRSGIDRFASVQVTPVDPRDLDKAWIAATCDLDDVRWSTPSDMARLAFHAHADAPRGWQVLCRLLGATPDEPAVREIPHLDWWRFSCSMDLTGHDDLFSNQL